MDARMGRAADRSRQPCRRKQKGAAPAGAAPVRLGVVLLGSEGELQAAGQRNDVVVFVTELFRTDEAGHEDAHARGEVVADVSGTGQKLGIGIIRVRIDTVDGEVPGTSGITNAEVGRPAFTGRSELQSLMRISSAVFCLQKKKEHN